MLKISKRKQSESIFIKQEMNVKDGKICGIIKLREEWQMMGKNNQKIVKSKNQKSGRKNIYKEILSTLCGFDCRN